MSRFVQLHFLVHYPVSNPNRDDLGEPKQATIGGTPRMRISSQCLKRTWRLSESFREAVQGRLGTRTRNLGKDIFDKMLALLIEKGVAPEDATKQATEWATRITSCFTKLKTEKAEAPAEGEQAEEVAPKAKGGKGKDKKEGGNKTPKLWAEQVVFISPSELEGIQQMCVRISEGFQPSDKELHALVQDKGGYSAADLAMFGRMMASAQDSRKAEVDGAAMVSHAFSVCRAETEDDYFSAVDDWPGLSEDGTGGGSAHNSVQRYASGLLYHYVCIDVDDLVRNLNGNLDLAKRSIHGLFEAALTTTPSGKKTSHAQNQFAVYAMVEVGNAQPFSYADVFHSALPDRASIQDAINRITTSQQQRQRVLPSRLLPAQTAAYSLVDGSGSFDTLLNLATEAVG